MLWLITAVFLISNVAQAQQDAGAKVILNKMSQKYKSFKTTSAQFTLRITQGKNATVKKGSLLLKSNKYKITFPDQLLMSDGNNVWSYVKENEEVELTSARKSADAFEPSTMFTFYQKGYKYVQEPDQKLNAIIYQVIDLVPTANNSNYFKIRMYIDKKSTSLFKVEVFSKDASRLTYTLQKVQANLPISDTQFVFNKAQYPNVEVVDLRN